MQENQFVDPPYRKKVYKLLSDNFSDFKTTEDDFNKKLDSDPLYATKVFDVLSNNFSDFKRSKDEFISMVSPVKKKDQAAQIGSMVGTDIGSSVLPKVAEVGPVAPPREPKTWSSLPWSSWADGSQLPSSSPSVKSKGQRALEKIESLDADFKDFETAYREAPNEFNAWAAKTFPTVKLENYRKERPGSSEDAIVDAYLFGGIYQRWESKKQDEILNYSRQTRGRIKTELESGLGELSKITGKQYTMPTSEDEIKAIMKDLSPLPSLNVGALPSAATQKVEDYNRTLKSVSGKIQQQLYSIAGSIAFDNISKKGGDLSPLEIGKEVIRMFNPQLYGMYKDAGGDKKYGGWGGLGFRETPEYADDINRQMTQIGNNVLMTYGNKAGISRALDEDRSLKNKFTYGEQEKVKNKIASILYNQGIKPHKASQEEINKAVSSLNEDEKSYWDIAVQNNNTKLPSTGFGYSLKNGYRGTVKDAVTTLLSPLIPSNSRERALQNLKEMSSSTIVGENPAEVARFEQLSEKRSAGQLNAEELSEYEDLSKRVKLRSGRERVFDFMGGGTGQLMGLGTISAFTGGLASAPSAGRAAIALISPSGGGASIMSAAYLMANESNQKEAMRLFPGDDTKQAIAGQLFNVVDMAVERIFPEEQFLSGGIKKQLADEIAAISTKNITKELTENLINKATKMVYRTGVNVAKAPIQEAGEETIGFIIKDGLITPSLGGQNQGVTLKNVLDVGEQAFWGSALLGAPKGLMSLRNPRVAIETLWGTVTDLNDYINIRSNIEKMVKSGALDKQDAADKVALMNEGMREYQSNPVINGQIGGLSLKQRQNYFARVMHEKALQRQMDNTSDENAKKELQAKIDDSKSVREKIYSKQVEVDEDNIEAPVITMAPAVVSTELPKTEVKSTDTKRQEIQKKFDFITDEDFTAQSFTPEQDAAYRDALPESGIADEKQLEDILNSGEFAMLTGMNPEATPLSQKANDELNNRAKAWLEERGLKPVEIFGKYDNSERSFFVPGMTRQQAAEFAREFKQESVAHSSGFVYQDGSFSPRTPGVNLDNRFDTGGNYFSTINVGGKKVDFSINYDFTKRVQPPASVADRLRTAVFGDNKAKVASAQKALEKTGVVINMIEDPNEYDAKVAQLGGQRGTEGIFVSDQGQIFINQSKLDQGIADGRVIWHEASHPVVNIIRNTNRPLFDKVISGLRQAANNNTGVRAVLDWAEQNYSEDGQGVVDDEAIVEAIANIADGRLDIQSLPTGLKQSIIDFINAIAKALGLGQIVSDTDVAAFKKVAGDVANALREGRDVSGIVGANNVSSFQNKLTQAKIDSRLSEPGIDVDRKEKLPLKISATKEQETVAKVNELINKYPKALTDRQQWKELMSRVFTYEGPNGELLIPAFPEGLARMASSVNEVSKELAKVSSEQRKLASEGLKGTKEIGKLYEEGKMDEVDTGLYFLWNIMSIGISPYPQESGFLQAVNAGVDKYISAAANGTFDGAMLEEYLEWVNTALPLGTPGAGSKSNLNSFGTNFLAKASDVIESGEFKGKTRLQALHEIISDRKTPTNDLRKKWHANMSNMYFNNKIFDFILLTTGRSDLFVVDRVRVDHFWDGDNMKKQLGLNPATSIYDGSELSYKASDGAGFSKMLSDVPGMVFTELANRAMADVVAKAYKKLGVNESPDVGRFHWETWVAASAQEVSHGSIDAIVQRKDGGKIKDAGIRQGKYGAWDFNFTYRKVGDQPFTYEFTDNNGNVYIFDDIRFVKEEIDNQAKKTYGSEETRFLLKNGKGDVTKRQTGDLSSAWYDQPGVDSQKYFDFLKSKAKEVIPAPDVVEDQGVVINKPQASKGNRISTDTQIIDGFYSPIENRVNDFKQPKASATKWKEIVGVKSDEAVFSGLADWLNSQKPDAQLSKQDVLNFMKDNRIEIKEVVRGFSETEALESEILNAVYSSEWVDLGNGVRAKGDVGGFSVVEINGIKKRLTTIEAENLISNELKSETKKPKYSQYQLPGGENYKEVLITMPSIDREVPKMVDAGNGKYYLEFNNGGRLFGTYTKSEAESVINKRKQKGVTTGEVKFKSSHFDEPNIITHLRMNTRTDADGKKVLFLEEVQSDWGQKGKREGFKSEDKNLQIEYDNAVKNTKAAEALLDKEMRSIREVRSMTSINNEIENGNKIVEDLYNRYRDAKSKELELLPKIRKSTEGVSPAPFVTNTNAWVKLGLKYALKEAVRQGADRIAWTTGEQQNERYSLSQKIQSITVDKTGDNSYMVMARSKEDGRLVVDKSYRKEELPDIIGKELANEMVAEADAKGVNGGTVLREGNNLKVGGKGMDAFYGDAQNPGIVANVAKALVKELTGKEGAVVESTISQEVGPHPEFAAQAVRDVMPGVVSESVQPAIEITPELRQEVKAGQPQFSKGNRMESSKDFKLAAFVMREKADGAPLSEIVSGIASVFPNMTPQEIRDLVDDPETWLRGKFPFLSKALQDNLISRAAVQNVFRPAPTTVDPAFAGLEVPMDKVKASRKKRSIAQRINKAVSNFKNNWIDPAKGLPDWVMSIKDFASGEKQLEISRAVKAVQQLKRVAKEIGFKDWDKFSEAIKSLSSPSTPMSNVVAMQQWYANVAAASKQLSSPPSTIPAAVAALPSEIIPFVYQMRGQIDRLTRDLIASGYVSPEQAATLEANLGAYVNRAYRLYNERGWKPAQAQIDEATKFKADEYIGQIATQNPTLSMGEVTDMAIAMAQKEVQAILDKKRNPYFGKAGVESRDTGILKERQDIPEPIRKLMGEYTDPGTVFVMTVAKQAALKASSEYLTNLRKMGMGSLFFEEKTIDATVKIASDASDTLSPLNGLYTTPEIADALEKVTPTYNAVTNAWMKAVGVVRWGKTVGSIKTQILNFESNLGFAVMNGLLMTGKTGQSFKDAAGYVKGQFSDKDITDLTEKVISLGLVGQGVSASELREMLGSGDVHDIALDLALNDKSTLAKAKRGAVAPISFLNKMYRMGDDFWKVYAYMNERALVSKAMYGSSYDALTPEQQRDVDIESSERVKNTWPTYDRVFSIVKKLSKNVPILGNFVSFRAESIRVLANTVKIAIKDLKSGDPGFQALGARRMAGIISYISLRSAITYAAAHAAGIASSGLYDYMFGDDDEQRKKEALKKAAPPFMISGDLAVYQHKDKPWRFTVTDLSSIDPYNVVFKTSNAFFEGRQGMKPGAMAAFKEFFGGFFDTEMSFGTLMDIVNNRDSKTGDKIVGDTDEGWESYLKVGGFIIDRLQPSTIGMVKRLMGKNAEAEAISILGMRPYEIDLHKSFSIKLSDMAKSMEEINKEYSRVKYNEDSSKEDIDIAEARAEEKKAYLIQKMNSLYNDFLLLGADKTELNNIIKDRSAVRTTGFDDKTKRGIRGGEYRKESLYK